MTKESPKKSDAKGKKSKVADLPARGLKAGEASKVKGGGDLRGAADVIITQGLR